MLVHLGIRDLAVVEALDLEFDPGLTVLTGETGAGKSILLTALGLALGDRADSGFIRPGATRAEIHLTFDLANSPAARAWLEENELDQGGACLIRRTLTQDGRSRGYINGRPVTLLALQDLGGDLAEIHGQHAHVHLLKTVEQRRLVDEAAGNQEILAQVEGLHRRWRSLKEECERRTGAARDQSAREDLLRYQVEELEQHAIPDLDYAALVEEHTLQANIGRVLERGQEQLDLLYEDEGHSMNTHLAQAVHALSELCPLAPGFDDIISLLGEAQVQIKEASLELRRNLESLEADPSRLEWLDRRLADVHRLARKHHLRPEGLPGLCEALRRELEEIGRSADTVEALRSELEWVASEYAEVAELLSARRRLAAAEMEERISAIIRELGMPHGRLMVKVEASGGREPTPYGVDTVEFLVSANPGLPPRPLTRVASGGELSRISLAIQVAATDSMNVGTLIFDEVDSGIGGGIAEIVGQKLRILGEQGRQVFCVTHLPQVAAQGHHHLLVEKRSGDGLTHSSVRLLSGDDRVREIARMLGGVRITTHTWAHAEEMLSPHAPAEH